MEIQHDETGKRFLAVVDGHEAHAAYTLGNGRLDIRHTLVPEAIGGRGVASALVKAAYDYALAHGFRFLSYGDSSLLLP